MTWFLTVVLLLLFFGSSRSFTVSNATFIHVSGFPQSGTTMVAQIVGALTGVGSLHDGCDAQVGKNACRKFNYEGQWLLHSADMQPGAMCPLPSDAAMSLRPKMLEHWGDLWTSNTSNHAWPERLYIQKSPQDMLKIPTLREAFRGARALRFIVVLKHPMTVHYTRQPLWSVAARVQRDLETVRYYLDTSIRPASAVRVGCSEGGWLQVVERFHKQLLQYESDRAGTETRDTLVVRFEESANPVALCRKLVRFVSRGHNSPEWEATALADCGTMFDLTANPFQSKTANPRHSKSQTAALPGTQRERDIPRFGKNGAGSGRSNRALGLHEKREGGEDGRVWVDRATSGVEPLQALIAAMGRMTSEQQASLDAYDQRLRRFGYSTSSSRLGKFDENVLLSWSS